MRRFVHVALALVFFAGAAGAVHWHYRVFGSINGLKASFKALETAGDTETFEVRRGELVTQLKAAGYNDSAEKVAAFVVAPESEGSPPIHERTAALRESALPKECPCRLTLAILCTTFGALSVLRAIAASKR